MQFEIGKLDKVTLFTAHKHLFSFNHSIFDPEDADSMPARPMPMPHLQAEYFDAYLKFAYARHAGVNGLNVNAPEHWEGDATEWKHGPGNEDFQWKTNVTMPRLFRLYMHAKLLADRGLQKHIIDIFRQLHCHARALLPDDAVLLGWWQEELPQEMQTWLVEILSQGMNPEGARTWPENLVREVCAYLHGGFDVQALVQVPPYQ
jgi:hypothetical protein